MEPTLCQRPTDGLYRTEGWSWQYRPYGLIWLRELAIIPFLRREPPKEAAASGRLGEDHLIEAVAAPVVDTSGAGDAFAAGFLYGVLGQKDPSPADAWATWWLQDPS